LSIGTLRQYAKSDGVQVSGPRRPQIISGAGRLVPRLSSRSFSILPHAQAGVALRHPVVDAQLIVHVKRTDAPRRAGLISGHTVQLRDFGRGARSPFVTSRISIA
jgi:hypothetical protein